MAELPAPPPEARLLKAARVARGTSIREAASRAGLSVSLWRQVEAGYITPAQGVHARKVAPPATLARMAYAVGLKAERLESEGKRADAAEILRDLPAREPGSPGQGEAALARTLAPPSVGPRSGLDAFPPVTPEQARAMGPQLAIIEARVTVAIAAYPGKTLTGSQVFPDSPRDAGTWDYLADQGYTVPVVMRGLAALLAWRTEVEEADGGDMTERAAG